MINTIQFWMIMLLGDVYLTWFTMHTLIKQGCSSPERYEANPLPKLFWKYFGLNLGTMLFAFIALISLYIIGVYVSLPEFSGFFLVGIYYIIYFLHFSNMFKLRKKGAYKRILDENNIEVVG